MSDMTISIITVCRNAKKEVSDLAPSLLAALGPEDEWVVQDGASTDGTVGQLLCLKDSRIRVESQPDGGIYDAMNRATTRATGDFHLFIGADDRLRIKLDEIRVLLKDPHTVYYGDVWLKAADCRYHGVFDGAKLARTNICQQAIFYPRAAFDKRSFDVRYTRQADWVFNMDCFSDPSLKFEYLPVIVADFDQSGVSSIAMDDAFQCDYRRLLKRYFSLRQRWRSVLLSSLSVVYRALPFVAPPRQKSLGVK